MSAGLWSLTAGLWSLTAGLGLAVVAAGWRQRALDAERDLRVERSATVRACFAVQLRERRPRAAVAEEHGAAGAAVAIRARSGEG